MVGSVILFKVVFPGIPCNSARNLDTYMASFAAWVRAIYSPSVEDRATVCCLLLDYDTADRIGSPCESDSPFESARTQTYPPVLLRVSRSPAQSASL